MADPSNHICLSLLTGTAHEHKACIMFRSKCSALDCFFPLCYDLLPIRLSKCATDWDKGATLVLQKPEDEVLA